jgi:hypothetical protein
MNERFMRIALEQLGIDTLVTRNNDTDDFKEVSVWGLRQALNTAYAAGVVEATKVLCK